MNDEDHHKHRKYKLLCIFAIMIGILGWILPEQEDIAFEYVVNNTDLYASGERTVRTNYTANNSAIQLFLIFHVVGTGASISVDTNLSINGTVVQDLDYRTTVGAGIHEHFSIVAHIPKGSIYNVTNSSNIETIEWREYPILSGRNGTLSINQYFNTTGGGTVNDSSLNLKVNKSGDIMTGQLDIFGELNTTSWNATQQPLFKNIYNINYNHNFTDPCTDNASGNCPVIVQELGTNKSVITVKHRLNPANDAYGILVNAEITNVTTLQNNSKTGWGFFARPGSDDFYVGRFTPGLSEFTIRVISNTTFAISQKNTTVLNLSSSRLAGVGNAYVCVDANGVLFRGSPGC